MKAVFALAATLLSATAAMAGTVTFTGAVTATDPTWTRPVAGNPPTPPASSVGVGVHYDVQAFTVGAAGNYSFLSTTAPSWDNYTFLYRNSFNPLSPFANVLIGNDDSTLAIGLSGFQYGLSTGTTYYFVTTSFAPEDIGAYSNTITGTGDITLIGQTAVPEPTSLALVGLALTGLALARRRSRA